MFALLYSVESLVPIMMTQAYASLWAATSAGRALKVLQCVNVNEILFSSRDWGDLLGRHLLLCLRHPHHHRLNPLYNWLVQVTVCCVIKTENYCSGHIFLNWK